MEASGGRERPRIQGAVAVATGLLLCLAGAASAQDIDQSNVFVGYSFLADNLFSGQHANLNGWNISAEKKYLPFFGLIGDVGGLYGSKDLPGSSTCGSAACLVHSDISQYTFDVGIRGSYGTATVRPFAEALFGEAHTTEYGPGLSNTNNGFDSMLGAGMDCRLTRRLGCRIDVDYIVTGSFVVRHNSIRASTGLVFRF
jgi:Outer membrane protein beta-barrel domain